MVGRLRPHVTSAQAAADLQLLSAAIAADHPETDRGRSAVLTPVSVTPPGERAWTTTILGSLVIVVLLTLLVACANVTNLLLGLSTSRRHEMLVRAALGASRLQLVMPPLRESLCLGLVSGVVGYGAAWIVLTKLSTFQISLGSLMPTPVLDLRPDALVLTATIITALLAGLVVGLAPALRGAADGLSGALNREMAIGEPRKARIRHALVVIQMTVATVVMVGVGVSIHSLVNLEARAARVFCQKSRLRRCAGRQGPRLRQPDRTGLLPAGARAPSGDARHRGRDACQLRPAARLLERITCWRKAKLRRRWPRHRSAVHRGGRAILLHAHDPAGVRPRIRLAGSRRPPGSHCRERHLRASPLAGSRSHRPARAYRKRKSPRRGDWRRAGRQVRRHRRAAAALHVLCDGATLPAGGHDHRAHRWSGRHRGPLAVRDDGRHLADLGDSDACRRCFVFPSCCRE